MADDKKNTNEPIKSKSNTIVTVLICIIGFITGICSMDLAHGNDSIVICWLVFAIFALIAFLNQKKNFFKLK